jgi:hypothetical protein
MPSSAHVIRRSHLDGLRCGSWLVEPGGVKDHIVHDWYHRGSLVAHIDRPSAVACEGEGTVLVSELPPASLPADPTGHWRCVTRTAHGQLVGLRDFTVAADRPSLPGLPTYFGGGPVDAGAGPSSPSSPSSSSLPTFIDAGRPAALDAGAGAGTGAGQ